LTHTKTDLNKLVRKDVNDIQDAINDPIGLRYCDCGMPVTQEAAQDKEMLISDLLTYLQQDPAMLAKVSSKIK
jgi:hypothetical protein